MFAKRTPRYKFGSLESETFKFSLNHLSQFKPLQKYEKVVTFWSNGMRHFVL